MNKVSSFSVAVVNTSVTAAFCTLYRLGTTPISTVLVLCSVFYSFSLFCKGCKVKPLFNLSVSFISCSYSLLLACRLIVDTKTLPSDKFPLLFIVCALTVGLVALGKPDSLRMNCVFAVSVAALTFVILFALGLLDTHFSRIAAVKSGNYPLPELIAFSVFDFYSVKDFVERDKKYSLFGALSLPLYFLISTVAAASVMSAPVFESLSRPLLSLWSSTYIPSFINRFEIVGLVCVFLLVIMKAAIMLANIYNFFAKKYAVLICIAISGFAILMFFYPAVITVFAVLTVVLSLFGSLQGLFVK